MCPDDIQQITTMNRKVVYNNCFGGFSITAEAVQLARQLSGNPNWGECVLKDELYPDGTLCTLNYGQYPAVPRHDPILVQVVEQLGDKACGRSSALAIATVDGPYRIVEYDGNETVETPDSIAWQ